MGRVSISTSDNIDQICLIPLSCSNHDYELFDITSGS